MTEYTISISKSKPIEAHSKEILIGPPEVQDQVNHFSMTLWQSENIGTKKILRFLFRDWTKRLILLFGIGYE